MFINSKIADVIRTSFHKFCDGTGLHGFIELYYAKALFWTVTWVVVVFASIVLTIFQVHNAIVQYIQESSITQIMPLDSKVLYPPMSMCYIHWIYWIDWKKTASLKMSKETVLYSLSFMTDIFSPTVFNTTEANENLTRLMSANNISTLTALYKNIARNFPMILGANGDTPIIIDDPPIFKTKDILYKNNEWYLCYTISGEEILANLKEKQKSATTFRTTGNEFNFSIADSDYSFYKSFITYEEYNYYMAYWLCTKSNYWVTTLKDFDQNYTGFTLPMKLYADGYSTKFDIIGTDNDFFTIVMTPSVHRWRNTRDRPCLEDQAAIYSENSCEEKCEAKHDNDLFTCMELDQAALLETDTLGNLCRRKINFLPYKHENPNFSPPCDNFVAVNSSNDNLTAQFNVEMKTKKNEDAAIEKNLVNCLNNCIETCEQWKYVSSLSVYTISQIVKKNTFKNQTDIYIQYPEEIDVLIVVEIDAQTWEDFIGNVGGLLGVWTGASILSILQAFYLCCFSENTCSCFDRFKLHREPELNGTNKRKRVKRRKETTPDGLHERVSVPIQGQTIKVQEAPI